MHRPWGPLAPLAGDWEGRHGVDVSFSHTHRAPVRTRYVERTTLTPVGPVRNGAQSLFGLEYRSAMCRPEDDSPLHTEVGYWLWDPAAGEVWRTIVLPRGITVLAVGPAEPDATELHVSTGADRTDHRIAETGHLAANARSLSYRASIGVLSDSSWRYEQTTTLALAELPDPFAHTDTNTLRRRR